MADQMSDMGMTIDEIEERSSDPTFGATKLRDIFLFERLTDDELEHLYKKGDLKRLKKNTHVVVEGEPTRGMYILFFGKVSVYKTDPVTNSLVRLAILESGANFGELSLFDSHPRSATVACESSCLIFQLDAEVFNEFLLERGQNVQVRFYQTCAEELAQRVRTLNSDYISSQQLLWKHALRRKDQDGTTASPASRKAG
jgi:CRP-like cAMP-binding protein